MAENDALLRMKLESGDNNIGVAELGLALTSISDLYEDFTRKMGADETESSFVVSDLKKGSAILEFVGLGIGLMDQALIMKQFHGAVSAQVHTWISGTKDDFSKQEDAQAKKLEGLANAVANSEDGNLTLAYLRESKDEREILMMTKQDGQTMLENFQAARNNLKEEKRPEIEFDRAQRLLMRLYQHNLGPNPSDKKLTSHKAIVRDIDSKPRPLTYENHEVADELNEIVAHTPYGGVIFDVVLELVREDSVLKAYRLVEIHGYFDDPDAPLLQS